MKKIAIVALAVIGMIGLMGNKCEFTSNQAQPQQQQPADESK